VTYKKKLRGGVRRNAPMAQEG